MQNLQEMQSMAHPGFPGSQLANKPKSSSVRSAQESSTLRLSEDAAGREHVTDMLSFCWSALHLYGKKPEDFAGIVQTYLGFLASYETSKVVAAFKRYIKHRREFPTPADIIGIIEGRIKRDASYYNRLRERVKQGDHLYSDEKEYLEKYEEQIAEDWE